MVLIVFIAVNEENKRFFQRKSSFIQLEETRGNILAKYPYPHCVHQASSPAVDSPPALNM